MLLRNIADLVVTIFEIYGRIYFVKVYSTTIPWSVCLQFISFRVIVQLVVALNLNLMENKIKLKTIGDGHCLLHAIGGSIGHCPSQPPKLDLHSIMCSIFLETVENVDKYVDFFLPPNNTHLGIFRHLRYYLLNKYYNNEFGDVVIQIAVNALHIQLHILDENIHGAVRESLHTPTNGVMHNTTDIFIYRKNEHFSAIAFMPAVSADTDFSNLSEPVAVPKPPEVQNRVVYTASELHQSNLHSDCSIRRCVRKALFKFKLWSPRPGCNYRKRCGANIKNLKRVDFVSSTKVGVYQPSRNALVNAQSIRNKTDLFVDYIIEQSLDLCMITETWLSPEDSVIMGELTPSGYHLQTFHRQNRPGGGIALVHKANLKVQTVQSGEQSSFEYIEATVTSESNSIRLLLVYRIPYFANHPVSSSVFFKEFAAYLETTLLIPDRLLIAGDLNFRIDCVEDHDASSFCDILKSMGLQQHVSGPTHRAGHT